MRTGKYFLYAALLVFDSAYALDATRYFPLQAGNEWVYSVNRTVGPSGTGVSSNTVTVAPGTVLVNGTPTTRVTETNGDITYYTSDSNGVRIHRDYDGEDFIEFTFSPAFKAVNAVFNIGDNLTGQTGDVSSSAYGILPYTASSSVANGVPVTVPAGTFPNTVKVTTTVVVDTSTLSGFTSNVTTEDVFWIAEHVGVVKSTYEYTDSTNGAERIFEIASLTSTNIVVPTDACAAEFCDYGGDGKADVLLRHTDGRWYYYPMDGKDPIAAQAGAADLIRNTAWQYQDGGDFNGDGKGDVLLRHTDGRWYYSPMDGKDPIAAQEGFADLVRNTAWRYQGSGDFNGDGNDDVLLRHTDGRWYYYPMDGKDPIAAQAGAADLVKNNAWQLAGIGDLNGDDKDDVLLRHTDGRWYYYPMDGKDPIAAQAGAADLVKNTAWQYAGIGDLNGDDKDDVLLRHTDGRWYYYPMDGKDPIAAQAGAADLVKNTAWQYAGIGDLNGDDKDDVLLRHTDGRWYYYPMDGKNPIAAQAGFADLVKNTDWALPRPANNIVFVTSTTQNANLGGLAGADAICNARAAAAALPGTYVAWMSTSTVDARDRLAGARGWVRPDGLPFADRVADLTAGIIFYPPRLDEFGNDLGVSTTLTATRSDGTLDTGPTYSNCMDWTDDDANSTVKGGYTDGTKQIWTSFVSFRCDRLSNLYCFGIDNATQVSRPAATGRLAFASDSEFAPSTGLAVADSLCQNDATAASLPGTYKALLATENVHAASRFNLTGSTWVRPDGVKVVEQASDLTDPQLFAPINLQADGITYLGNDAIWKGADDFNTVGVGTSCGGWTSSLGNGTIGRAAKSVPLTVDTSACTALHQVYCLQE